MMMERRSLRLADQTPQKRGKVIAFTGKRREHKRLAWFFLGVLILGTGVWFVLSPNLRSSLRRRAAYDPETVIVLESGGRHRSAGYRAGLAVAGSSGLEIYDKSGALLSMTAASMDTPALRAVGDYALAFDVGGKALTLYRYGKGVVLDTELEGALLDADLSRQGYAAVTYQGETTKSVLQIYNKSHAVSYTVYSGTRYLAQCAVSEDGSYGAAIALGQADGLFQSCAVVYHTSREGAAAEISLGNQLIYDLAFLGDRTLCAVGETETVFFSVDGTVLGRYGYSGLSAYAASAWGAALLTVSGGEGTLTTVDAKGRILGQLPTGVGEADLEAAGDYLSLLQGGSLTLYNKKLTALGQTQMVYDASQVALWDDGSAFLVGSQRAYRYLPEE